MQRRSFLKNKINKKKTRNCMSLQDVADKVYKKYGDDKCDLKILAQDIEKWGFNTTLEDAMEALEISRKKAQNG